MLKPHEPYRSKFYASAKAERILRDGKILSQNENPQAMIERVVSAITIQDYLFTEDVESSNAFGHLLGTYLDDKSIVLSTPIMTNAGRYADKPLSACIMPPISLMQDYKSLSADIDKIHAQGMGAGFNLTDISDPTSTLRTLNAIAVNGAESGNEDRPVGNMAILSVYHPLILEFINAKIGDEKNKASNWKFNISIDLDEAFFQSLEKGEDILLLDGSKLSSATIFERLSAAALVSGDPGIVFMDRMNKRNPSPGLGTYKTIAPCAEVGLTEGEACQFGYINASKYLNYNRNKSEWAIDVEKLLTATQLLTRCLDNALEISIKNYSSPKTKHIMQQKRKIGIGLCGVADAVSLVGLEYDSEAARAMITDMLSYINHQSKLASIELAELRGSCLFMNQQSGNRYYETKNGFLYSLFKNSQSRLVQSSDWQALDNRIRKDKKLRNISTIALAPTGRSSLVIDASTGIEPHFSLEEINEKLKTSINEHAQSLSTLDRQRYLATAQEISPEAHIAMASSLQSFTDEAISKTINLPSTVTPKDIMSIYLQARNNGLNGLALYVDKSHVRQPRAL